MLSGRIKIFLEQFFLIDDTPHKIAAGAALGVFLGILPGEGILTTLALSVLLRLNRLSALTAVLAVNMWTTVIALPLAAAVGAFLFKVDSGFLIDKFDETYRLGILVFLSKAVLFSLLLPLAVGFIIVASIVSLVFYAVLYWIIKARRRKQVVL